MGGIKVHNGFTTMAKEDINKSMMLHVEVRRRPCALHVILHCVEWSYNPATELKQLGTAFR